MDSGAYKSAIAQNDLDRLKQQVPANILQIDDPTKFQFQKANGLSEKPLASATLRFDIRDHYIAGNFVLMKKLTAPITALQSKRHKSIVNDTTHGLIPFPHLTRQMTSVASEASAKHQLVFVDGTLKIPPKITKRITAFVCHPSEGNSTATVTPLGKLTEAPSLLIFHLTSTIIDKKVPTQLNHFTRSGRLHRLPSSP